MISTLIRDDLKELSSYQTAQKRTNTPYIRLHANESPWSLSEENLNRYPKQLNKELPAQFYGVKTEQLIVTRGSNEGIDLLVRLFCTAGSSEVVIVTPTFGMYYTASQIQGIRFSAVELEEKSDFRFEVDKIIQKINDNTRLIFICTPNNPTANAMSLEDIRALCEYCRDRYILVIDEAYIEFSEQRSATALINEYSNLVILRTLSKAFGLAGIRAGFVIANEAIINSIELIIPPYPIPTPCVEVIESSMSNQKIVQMWINATVIKNSRTLLITQLGSMGVFEKIYPSETNFILTKVKQADLLQTFASKRGVLLRLIDSEKGLLRISVGSTEENDSLVKILDEWRNCREN